jgi:hypothetical protein
MSPLSINGKRSSSQLCQAADGDCDPVVSLLQTEMTVPIRARNTMKVELLSTGYPPLQDAGELLEPTVRPRGFHQTEHETDAADTARPRDASRTVMGERSRARIIMREMFDQPTDETLNKYIQQGHVCGKGLGSFDRIAEYSNDSCSCPISLNKSCFEVASDEDGHSFGRFLLVWKYAGDPDCDGDAPKCNKIGPYRLEMEPMPRTAGSAKVRLPWDRVLWITQRILIPAGNDFFAKPCDDGVHTITWQVHANGQGWPDGANPGGPMAALMVQCGYFWIRVQGVPGFLDPSTKEDINERVNVKIEPDTWYHLTLRTTFSYKTRQTVELWLGEAMVWSRSNVLTAYNEPQEPFFKFGLYAHEWMQTLASGELLGKTVNHTRGTFLSQRNISINMGGVAVIQDSRHSLLVHDVMKHVL